MEVEGDYRADGAALVRGLVPPEICNALLRQFQRELDPDEAGLDAPRTGSPLLVRDVPEVYGFAWSPLVTFLWGLTPAIRSITALDLVPSYDYLRVYREGDLCRVHSDRPSCEHSLSLTLDYSDGEVWPLEVGATPLPEPLKHVSDDFESDGHRSFAMQPGDGVLYNGVHRRHGRITPNPNGWSAHLFMHWVTRGGPFAEHAFDARPEYRRPVNFRFAD